MTNYKLPLLEGMERMGLVFSGIHRALSDVSMLTTFVSIYAYIEGGNPEFLETARESAALTAGLGLTSILLPKFFELGRYLNPSL